jgi:hypothetical protein
MMTINNDRTNVIKTFTGDELTEYITGLRKQLQDQDLNPYLLDVSAAYVSITYTTTERLHDTTLAIGLARRMGIRTPSIQRVVPRKDGYECIYKRVHGSNIMDVGAGISWFTAIRLAFHLRKMVRWMRTQTSPTAGSLGIGIERTFWLEDACGIPLHASPETITSLVNFWNNQVSFLQDSRKTRQDHEATCQEPMKSQLLVFKHHDLTPRN